jgi:hypothetical protein
VVMHAEQFLICISIQGLEPRTCRSAENPSWTKNIRGLSGGVRQRATSMSARIQLNIK